MIGGGSIEFERPGCDDAVETGDLGRSSIRSLMEIDPRDITLVDLIACVCRSFVGS